MAKARRRRRGIPTHVAREYRRGIYAARATFARHLEEPPLIAVTWVPGGYPPPLWDAAYTVTLMRLRARSQGEYPRDRHPAG